MFVIQIKQKFCEIVHLDDIVGDGLADPQFNLENKVQNQPKLFA